MKYFVIFLLTLLSFCSEADEKVKIISSAQANLEFIPYLKDENLVSILKFGNDGQNSLIESINTPNSLYIATTASSVIREREKLNSLDPFDEMEVLGIIGKQIFTVATAYDSQFKSIEDIVEFHKKTNTPIKWGGSSKLGTCFVGAKYVQKKYGIPVEYIQYKLGLQVLVDLKDQKIDVTCRYGMDIQLQSESKMIRHLMKFTTSDVGILKDVPVGISIDNYMVLFANKKTDKKIKDKIISQLTDTNYLKEIKNLESTKQIYFETILDKKVIEKSKKEYLDLLNDLCNNELKDCE